MNDLRKSFVNDQQEAAAEDNRRHQMIVAHMMNFGRGPVGLEPAVLDLLAKKMGRGMCVCDHIEPVGPFDFPGQVYWLLGINVMTCGECLAPAHALLEAVIASGSDTCDLCDQPEPSGLFREAIITLNHILAFGCEGWTCCRTIHNQ